MERLGLFVAAWGLFVLASAHLLAHLPQWLRIGLQLAVLLLLIVSAFPSPGTRLL